MTLQDIIRFARVNALLMFVTASLGLLASFLYTLTQPVVFSASSTALVVAGTSDTVGDAFSGSSLAQARASTYTALANSLAVGEAMAEDLGDGSHPAALAGSISASVVPATAMIQVSASADSPQAAADRANAAVRAIRDQAMALENAGRAEGEPMSSVVQVVPNESALVPGRPTSPNYPRNLAGGTAAGLVLGVGIGLLRRQLDRRVRTVEDVEQSMNSSVLGIIPESQELNRESRREGPLEEQGAAAESLRQLRTNLRFVDVDNPPRSIVITSASPGEGKSTVTSNLARVLAHAGQKTIVVDADLRRPTVARTFAVDAAVGLTQVLAGDVELDDAVQATGDPHLEILTAGRIPPNPSELLGSQRMQQVIADLSDRGYLVLLDAPPLLPVTDAGLLSAVTDGTILVIRLGSTQKEQISFARKVLDQVGGKLLGTVLNRAALKGMGSVVYGYGYRTYKHDYYASSSYNTAAQASKKGRGLRRNRATASVSSSGSGERRSQRRAGKRRAP